jgi:NADPH:quinone reductase-like Zn-dependent oxidoreductase
MKAVRFHEFGDLDVLRIDEVPIPEPGPDQIRIAVRACGVNPADWKVAEGVLGGELPMGLGFEAAGVVDARGDRVTDVEVGDRVFGSTGAGAAEYALLDAYALIPSGLDFTEAAALPLAVETATRGVDLLGIDADQTVLINGGAGAVGTIATQLAVMRGARVIATASERNFERLRSYGAEPTSYEVGLADRVAELAPDGVDLIFDMGPDGSLPELVKIAGTPDHVLTISDFDSAPSLGVRTSGREGTIPRWDSLKPAAELAGAGKLVMPVQQTFPLDDYRDAQEISKTGHVTGKLVIVLD